MGHEHAVYKCEWDNIELEIFQRVEATCRVFGARLSVQAKESTLRFYKSI